MTDRPLFFTIFRPSLVSHLRDDASPQEKSEKVLYYFPTATASLMEKMNVIDSVQGLTEFAKLWGDELRVMMLSTSTVCVKEVEIGTYFAMGIDFGDENLSATEADTSFASVSSNSSTSSSSLNTSFAQRVYQSIFRASQHQQTSSESDGNHAVDVSDSLRQRGGVRRRKPNTKAMMEVLQSTCELLSFLFGTISARVDSVSPESRESFRKDLRRVVPFCLNGVPFSNLYPLSRLSGIRYASLDRMRYLMLQQTMSQSVVAPAAGVGPPSVSREMMLLFQPSSSSSSSTNFTLLWSSVESTADERSVLAFLDCLCSSGLAYFGDLDSGYMRLGVLISEFDSRVGMGGFGGSKIIAPVVWTGNGLRARRMLAFKKRELVLVAFIEDDDEANEMRIYELITSLEASSWGPELDRLMSSTLLSSLSLGGGPSSTPVPLSSMVATTATSSKASSPPSSTTTTDCFVYRNTVNATVKYSDRFESVRASEDAGVEHTLAGALEALDALDFDGTSRRACVCVGPPGKRVSWAAGKRTGSRSVTQISVAGSDRRGLSDMNNALAELDSTCRGIFGNYVM